MGLTLEDLLQAFVCSETVDSVYCGGCQQQNSVQPTSAVKTKFVKRLTFGKVRSYFIFLKLFDLISSNQSYVLRSNLYSSKC